MRAYVVIILIVMGLATRSVNCRRIQVQELSEQDIPVRCDALSVTPVSCDQPAPQNLLPHPDDCELFYYCVNTAAKPICRQCPAQLHFNPRLLVCDNPDDAGCVSRIPILP